MKSSKNFNVRSTGFDYTKQRSVNPSVEISSNADKAIHKEDEKKMDEYIYVKRPTFKKMNNRFQK